MFHLPGNRRGDLINQSDKFEGQLTMSIIKKKYICPFCFEKNNLYDVEFRCSNQPGRCTPVPDPVLSKFRGVSGAPLMQRIVSVPPPANNNKVVDKLKALKMPRNAVCDACNERTNKRVCPDCHSELPHTIGEYKDLIFSVIGAKEAGKSHYIAMLIEKIKSEIGLNFNCNLHPLNDETIKRYRNDFYNPIFRNKQVIQATRSATADFNVRSPMIYTLSFMGKGWFGKNKIRDVATVEFFDTAGEDLDDENTMAVENKYIYNSSGIIFLLDPLQLPNVRELLPPNTDLPNENSEADDLIARTATLIRRANNIKSSDLIDIPVAVAFSKIDALGPILDPSNSLNYQSKHNGVFDVGDFEDVSGEMESCIHEWAGAKIIQQVKGNFKNYAFFGLTALGCNPHGTQRIKALKPNRVEDPFLWLLWKYKLIKANKARS